MGKGFSFSISRLFTPRRRARIESVAAEAEALIRDLGDSAYSEARRRENEASSDAIADDWNCVALAVASKLRVGNAMGASERASREAAAPDGERASRSPPGQGDKHRPVLEARPQTFRIQFVGEWSDRGPSVLREVEIQVLDLPSAIVEAANLQWPPRTIALRILDREGREVFERHRADRR